MTIRAWTGAILVCALALPGAPAAALDAKAVNEAGLQGKGDERARAAKLQVLLDRARFSPGVIDGRPGENVDNALAAFRAANGLSAKGKGIDAEAWDKLGGAGAEPVVVEYTVTEADVKGPFAKEIPDAMEEMKDLDRLSYTSPLEAFAERFHMDEDFLEELNPGQDFGKVGTVLLVAAAAQPDGKAESVKRIEADRAKKQLRAYGENDRLIAVYPATIGSKARPAPTGTHPVEAVVRNPDYTYNPAYRFEGVKSDKPFRIAPGPNNPVGSTWIDLGGEGYGIHGTPEPSSIGKTASHGCVRLTNWDAEALARMVKRGVPVEFLGPS